MAFFSALGRLLFHESRQARLTAESDKPGASGHWLWKAAYDPAYNQCVSELFSDSVQEEPIDFWKNHILLPESELGFRENRSRHKSRDEFSSAPYVTGSFG